MRCLEADHYLWHHNLTTLQALVILIYGINQSHGQSWTLLGLAYHLAIAIGCHVDPTNFKIDVVEREERRRCWVGLTMLLRNQNAAMGNIGLPYSNLPSNSRLPVDCNDEDVLTGVEASLFTLTEPTDMTYLLFRFRLFDISAKICDKVLTARDTDLHAIGNLHDQINREQDLWKNRYGQSSRVAPLSTENLLHFNVLLGHSHHLTLLLHRAVIRNPLLDISTYCRSLEICRESSRVLLEIHESFHENPALAPYAWYNRGRGSFHAFHAATTLISVFSSGVEQPSGSDSWQIIQACLARVTVMSSISPLCGNIARILRGLT